MGHCIVLDVDGEPVRFQLTVPPDQLTDEDREGLIELARAIRERSNEPKWDGTLNTGQEPQSSEGP